ncbi:hypothetical protein KI387_036295, partial [Taxus chinensis]
MEAIKGDDDDEEHGEAQNHPVYDVHKLKEEGNEEMDENEEGDHEKGGSEEVNMKDQKTLNLTKEQMDNTIKREV